MNQDRIRSPKDSAHFMNELMDPRKLKELDGSVVWHGFSQMKGYSGPIIERGEGCWLIDLEGNRFLDGTSSLWCNVHGHCHPKLNQAIIDQLSRVAHVTNLGMSNPEAIRLSARLAELAPGDLKHVFFSSDGASAVEVALKMAFQYWQQCEEPQPERTKFLALGSAYHGDTIGTVALGGVERFHAQFHSLLFPVLRGPCPNGQRSKRVAKSVRGEGLTEGSSNPTFVQPGTEESGEDAARYLKAYREILIDHAQEIAAVVVEPLLQCAAGMVFHPVGFLKGMEQLCREFDVLLIVDEIAVGMGRAGTLFASEQEHVQPDLVCIGKGLTGGYLPMSATLTNSRVFDAFLGDASKTFYHGHTYGGNPLAAAVANATLDLTLELLASDGWKNRVDQLEMGLKKLSRFDDVLRADQLGLLGAIELRATEDRESESKRRSVEVCERAMERGVWLRPLGDCVPIVPPMCISEQELELLLESLEYGLDPTVKVR